MRHAGPAPPAPPLPLPQRGSSDTGTFRPPPVEGGWGPTQAEIARARSLVGRLLLRERAGQVIVASYGGTAAPTDLVRRLHLGGVVSFSENIAGAAQAARSNRALQRSAARDGRRWPVLVGVDQEGGRVARVTSGVTGFPAFMTAGAAADPALTREAYAASGGELLGLGFTVDFAPGRRRHRGPSDPAIGARSAGVLPRAVRRPRDRCRRGLRVGRPAAGRQALPGPRLRHHRQPLGLPVQRRSPAAARGPGDLVPFRAASPPAPPR